MIQNADTSPQPPSVAAFAAGTALCVVAIFGSYFALSPRNDALLAKGEGMFLPLTALDAGLPLVPEMVWAYALFYPSFLAVAFVTLRDRRAMWRGVFGYVATALLSLLAFAALPSQMAQPSLSTCPSTSCALLAWIYAADDGHHIFPSLHVAYPVVTWLVLRRARHQAAAPFLVVVLIIAASTVLTKRHALVDVPAGAVFGALGYALGSFLEERLDRARVSARTAHAATEGPAAS